MSDLERYIAAITNLQDPKRQICTVQLHNSRDTPCGGVFEPWGMTFDIPAKATIDIVAYGPPGDWLPRESLAIGLQDNYVSIWQARTIDGIGIFCEGTFLPNLELYAGVIF